ncbi:MAG: hypothetical protein QNJ53_03355 [Pleurocapsa sp. MO_192.B19]|nr:hypothetical protein [Pleurocapsa sp. MO_192.B19]
MSQITDDCASAHWLANRLTKIQTGKVTLLFTAYDGDLSMSDLSQSGHTKSRTID